MFDLYDRLQKYCGGHKVPMHMPGHKRNQEFCSMENPYAVDITEIDGFDNLHHAQGILKEAQRQAAQIYGARQSFFLVNGSSCGMLAAVSAAAQQGKNKILMARNCHKSVYNALYLNDLTPVYNFPEVDKKTGIHGPVSPSEIEEALAAEKECCAVVLTSPTYEGNVSDIGRIAQLAHAAGVPLIIDSAHGAHFHFHEAFPADALSQGADVVVESLHKTLPALTQTAILHVSQSGLISPEQIFFFLDMFESTSPSYILLASIEQCMAFVEKNRKAFDDYAAELKRLRNEISALKNIRLLPADDISKLIIASPYLKGQEIYDILLKDYEIQMEMASLQYAVAMTSVCDRPEDYRRLLEALRLLDERLEGRVQTAGVSCKEELLQPYRPKACLSMRQAMEKKAVLVPFSEALGRISAGFVAAYPPGSPLITPGEEIDERFVERLTAYIAQGIEVVGADKGLLRVCE